MINQKFHNHHYTHLGVCFYPYPFLFFNVPFFVIMVLVQRDFSFAIFISVNVCITVAWLISGVLALYGISKKKSLFYIPWLIVHIATQLVSLQFITYLSLLYRVLRINLTPLTNLNPDKSFSLLFLKLLKKKTNQKQLPLFMIQCL